MKGPRIIKTHFPIMLLPENTISVGAKIVYVASDPKDVAVSWCHLSRLYLPFRFINNLETFVEYFTNDLITYGPYWEHIKSSWRHRNDENVLFMFYEDMILHLKGSLMKLF